MALRVERVGFAVAAILAFLAIAAVWAHLVSTLRHPEPVTSTLAPNSIAWNGRVFSDREELAAWLRRRGTRYAVWARIHPAAAAVLDPSAARPERTRPAKAAPERTRAKPAPRASSTRRTAAPALAAPTRDTGRSWWPLGLAAFASLLALLTLAAPTLIRGAVVPARLAPHARLIAQHQVPLIMAAATLAFGVLVGVVLN